MADKYLNATDLQEIADWGYDQFAQKSAFNELAEEVAELITEGGEPNVIEIVKVNNSELTPDVNKAVNISVPTISKSGAGESEKVTVVDGQNSYDVPTVDAMEDYVGEHGGVIQKVKLAGTELTIDSSDKSVNIPLATTSANGAMSSTDKTKLDGVEAGAQENVQADWNQSTSTEDDFIKNKPTKLSDFTNDGDGTTGSTFPTTAQMNTAIGTALTSAMEYKGAVATVADLPSSGNKKGDFYNVTSTGGNYAWNGSAWDYTGGELVDTSVLWTSVTGQSNTLEAMTVAEVRAILYPSTP